MITSLEPGGTELGNEPKGVVLDTTQLVLTNFILHSCVLSNMTKFANVVSSLIFLSEKGTCILGLFLSLKNYVPQMPYCL